MLSEEENKSLARRFLLAFANGDLDTLDELLAPGFEDRSLLPGQGSSREEYKQSAAEFYDAFSIADFTIEDQIVEGDKVMTKFSTTSIHQGEFLGVPPSGEVATYSSIRIHRIAGSKVAEEWSEGNLLGVMLPSFEREIRARERVEQELRVARSIQQASLPKEVPSLQDWRITPYYRPAREVGGDFYDFFELEAGQVALVMGDATGKGVPAALVVGATSSMLRAVAQGSDFSPGEVLERVNEALSARISSNTFVTCFYAVLDPRSGRLGYANAGHNPPFWRHEHAAVELKARGMPLGLMPGMFYEEGEADLARGDSVIFHTDGLVEAHNPRGEMFGTPRLKDLLSMHPGNEAGLDDALMEELQRFTGEGWEQEDDITLLTLQHSANPDGT